MSENERRILQRSGDPLLFRPITLRSVTARNRVMMSPMCQYSAVGGVSNEWHFSHLASRAAGGVGIVCVEATHVEERGRITPGCLGLWNEAQRNAFIPLVAAIERLGATPAIQLAHAGRKASVSRPWEGSKPLKAEEGEWRIIGPSPIPFAQGHQVPHEMNSDDIATVVEAFRGAAKRAREAGFKIVEVHGAHGYLVHSFLSPVANHRTDAYGGPFENRIRLLEEILDAVRSEWPAELPLFVRISATDWLEGGWTLEDSIRLARRLKARGDVDLVDCSSGGINTVPRVPSHPGYQTPFAEAVRREAQIATGAVGLISTPDHAEEIVANGRADLVLLGRVLLHNPHWALHAAKALGAQTAPWPVQYERGSIY